MTDKFKIIFVLGTPGAGKNTMCDMIKEKYQIYHFSCGDLLREAVQENAEEKDLINKYMKEGKIVPAKITCGLQKKTMIKNGKDYSYYLCDGFPRNEENENGEEESEEKEEHENKRKKGKKKSNKKKKRDDSSSYDSKDDEEDLSEENEPKKRNKGKKQKKIMKKTKY